MSHVNDVCPRAAEWRAAAPSFCQNAVEEAAMSASHGRALDAVAWQIAATVELYQGDVDALVSAWPDTAHYQPVNRRMDQIRMMSASHPSLAVPFVTLLIAQAELVHCLWRRGLPGGCDLAELRRCHAAVATACVALREQCAWLTPAHRA
jgi:hypothetical protein